MGHRYPKRSQLKYTKQRYRVRNWREYEVGLRKRGDLTLWFSEEGCFGHTLLVMLPKYADTQELRHSIAGT